jgi:peptidylprolyl isomerase
VDPAIADQPDGLYALFETSRGNILASLDLQRCPMTVTAFIGLAEGTIKAAERPGRFYDGLVFHRVVSKAAGAEYDFMIQGGDPAGDGSGGPGFSFADELDPALNFDAAGRLAMANGGPDSNGSQFFITLAPAPWLDQRHTIFGQVMKGQDNAAGILPGDKITKLTILRKGMAAEAFQADPAAFDLSQKAAADVYAKKIADAVAKALPGAQKAPDGALFVIDRPGSGAAPLAGQTVTMNYSGSFLSGRTVDASPEGQPVSVKVGTGRLIAGWDQALMDMKTGEKRRVLLPPELAFGANGISGMIPPGSWLLLDIELVSVSN